MADKKITALAAAAAAAETQLFEVVTNPGGTPVSEKLTVSQLATFLASLAQTLTNKTIDSAVNTITLAASTITSGQIAAARGGTGIDSSALTGIAKVTAGVWATFAPAANVETFLTTPNSANLRSAVTDETGTGALVFANTPTFVTPVLGAATGTSVDLSSYSAVGATPATAGSNRFSNVASACARDAANANNLTVWESDAGDNLYLGTNAATTSARQFVSINAYARTTFDMGVGTSLVLRLNSTGAQLSSGFNLAVNGVGSFGGGSGVISVKNAAANPSSNPTGGGVLYADTGAGKWRGSGGTITTFGPAEPHCPRCGTDVGISQSENDLFGEELIHCHACELRTGNGVVRHFADFFERKAT